MNFITFWRVIQFQIFDNNIYVDTTDEQLFNVKNVKQLSKVAKFVKYILPLFNFSKM